MSMQRCDLLLKFQSTNNLRNLNPMYNFKLIIFVHNIVRGATVL